MEDNKALESLPFFLLIFTWENLFRNADKLKHRILNNHVHVLQIYSLDCKLYPFGKKRKPENEKSGNVPRYFSWAEKR